MIPDVKQHVLPIWVNRDAKISSAMEAKRTWPNKSATLRANNGHPVTLTRGRCPTKKNRP
jgi:hypothetical protein